LDGVRFGSGRANQNKPLGQLKLPFFWKVTKQNVNTFFRAPKGGFNKQHNTKKQLAAVAPVKILKKKILPRISVQLISMSVGGVGGIVGVQCEMARWT
jgi:hypothetical protein